MTKLTDAIEALAGIIVMILISPFLAPFYFGRAAYFGAVGLIYHHTIDLLNRPDMFMNDWGRIEGLSNEVLDWLDANKIAWRFDHHDVRKLRFRRTAHAVAFKLRWC